MDAKTTTLDAVLSTVTTDAELEEFAEMLGPSLGFPTTHATPWLRDRMPPGSLRVVKQNGVIASGLGTIAMGQWFGGRSVPCVGINAVAVLPERRASGLGTAMMRAVLRELREKNVALSALYPATYPVYRAVGYESAGTYLQFSLEPATLRVRDAELSVRRAGPDDHETIRALYQRRARSTQGNLDRNAYMWDRVFAPGGETAMVYLFERSPRVDPQGYLAFTQTSASPPPGAEMRVRDHVALTPAAGRRLLSFLGEHRSIVKKAVLTAAPSEPLFLLAREEPQTVARYWHWMLRVVDVREALARRGYPAGYKTEVHFEVRDEVLPENQGRWVLEVGDGAAEVRAGGRGEVQLDVRGLAALYSGYLDPIALREAGLCDGADEALTRAGALFAGPAPWMPDFF